MEQSVFAAYTAAESANVFQGAGQLSIIAPSGGHLDPHLIHTVVIISDSYARKMLWTAGNGKS